MKKNRRGDRPQSPAPRTGTMLIITFTVICLLIMMNCGGGFKKDGEGTDILGPGIFGPDTAR